MTLNGSQWNTQKTTPSQNGHLQALTHPTTTPGKYAGKTGTFSKNLPASTDDGEGYTMKFEYESDDNGRLVKATESDNGVEYTFSYGEQTLPDYGIPEVTTK